MGFFAAERERKKQKVTQFIEKGNQALNQMAPKSGDLLPIGTFTRKMASKRALFTSLSLTFAGKFGS